MNVVELAEQLYPERQINMPEGQAVIVPMQERKAFIAGATWQAAQVLPVLEPFVRHAGSISLSNALGHIERAHLVAARDLVDQLLRDDLIEHQQMELVALNRLSEDYVG